MSNIFINHGDLRTISSSLSGVAEASADEDSFTLAGMASDLVTAGADAFAKGWSDQLAQFTMISGGLAGAVDDTIKDFLATEQENITSLLAFIEELDG